MLAAERVIALIGYAETLEKSRREKSIKSLSDLQDELSRERLHQAGFDEDQKKKIESARPVSRSIERVSKLLRQASKQSRIFDVTDSE